MQYQPPQAYSVPEWPDEWTARPMMALDEHMPQNAPMSGYGIAYGGPSDPMAFDDWWEREASTGLLPMEYAPSTLDAYGMKRVMPEQTALTESYGDLQSSWSQSMARDAAEWPAKSALVPSLEQQQLFLPMMPMMSTPHAALVAQINALDLSLRQQVAQLVDTLQPGVVHKNESEWTFTVSQLTDSTVAYVMQALANAKGALAEPRWALPSELLEADVALRKRQSESGEMMLTPAAKRIKTEELSDEYSTEDSSEYTASPDELASPTSPMDESSADATSAHSCAVCKKSFPTATSLNKHLKTHSDERQFACTHPGCQKRFSHSSTLKDHMNIHLQRKPYTCKECGKGFPNGSNLNRHARIHTKSKPYVCNVCNKAFSQSSNLRVHQKIHDRPPKHE